MPITTDRLLLRPREVGEGAALAMAVNESLPQLKPWMIWAQERQSSEEAEAHILEKIEDWQDGTELALTVCDRQTGKIVGSSGYHAIHWGVPRLEIGYWVRHGHTGQGIATECTAALTLFAFQALHAKRVEVRCDATNTASRRVPEKLGFQLDATLQNYELATDGSLRDTLIFSRLHGDGLQVPGLSW